MQVAIHGGLCCGIKHIHGLGSYPSVIAPPAEKVIHDPENTHKNYYNYYKQAMPRDFAENRFYLLLDWIQSCWIAQLVEVSIYVRSQKDWIPVLEKCGFKKTNEFRNSNTNHICQTWHLAYDTAKDGKGKFKEKFGRKDLPPAPTSARPW